MQLNRRDNLLGKFSNTKGPIFVPGYQDTYIAIFKAMDLATYPTGVGLAAAVEIDLRGYLPDISL